ncbi:hypothetical protein M7I_5317 [Glarea lozoyensis 74030]|uniref:Uncharacterized protein n=1 Tax=Glarea lozoyensis (strain ATCC 74030 / MF5533) TaxID=1104152 RepID=H0ERJ8_GLAL7|nr:hypothetical protein M7I_5317 [Glarea lozoyensis 74030]
MLSVYQPPPSEGSSLSKKKAPPGVPYLTKVNGKLVMARAKPKYTPPKAISLLGEAFGVTAARKRAKSISVTPPEPLMIGGIPRTRMLKARIYNRSILQPRHRSRAVPTNDQEYGRGGINKKIRLSLVKNQLLIRAEDVKGMSAVQRALIARQNWKERPQDRNARKREPSSSRKEKSRSSVRIRRFSYSRERSAYIPDDDGFTIFSDEERDRGRRRSNPQSQYSSEDDIATDIEGHYAEENERGRRGIPIRRSRSDRIRSEIADNLKNQHPITPQTGITKIPPMKHSI